MRKALVLVLTAALSGVLSVGTISAAHAKPKFSVTISSSTSSLDLGKTFTLKGKVSPSSKGKTVKIQRKYAGGSWSTITTRKLSSSSSYSATIKPTRGGTTFYRVQKPGTSSRGTGTSTTASLEVYKWLDLVTTEVDFVQGNGSNGGSATINGALFGHSLIADSGLTLIGWDLTDRGCDRYRVYVGTLEGSEAGATSSFGVGLYSSSAYLTQGSTPLDLTSNMHVSDHARVLSRQFPDTTNRHFGLQIAGVGNGQHVAAEPSVHCNANS